MLGLGLLLGFGHTKDGYLAGGKSKNKTDGLSGPDPPTPTITWSLSFAHSRSPREQVCRAGHLGHLAARLALRAVLGCFGPRIRCAARRTSGGDSFGLSSNEVVQSKRF